MAGKAGPLSPVRPARSSARLCWRQANRPSHRPRRLEHADRWRLAARCSRGPMTKNNLRESEIVEFLTRAGWGEAARTPLTADASTRRYERLRRKTQTAMLMDAPPL